MNSSKQRPTIKLTPWSLIALAYPLGLGPKAPGTFGSLAGIPLGLGFYGLGQHYAAHDFWLNLTLVLSLLLLFTLFSWKAIDATEKSWNTHDDSRIVIDEVLGQAIPLSFYPGDWQTILLAFGLFRFFDIVKPGPIGWIDRHLPGALGTLLDDVLAGIFALFGLWLWQCLPFAAWLGLESI